MIDSIPSGAEVAQFLRGMGWRLVMENPGRLSRWETPGDPSQSLLAPLDQSAPDYSDLLGTTLGNLASTMGISPAETSRRILLGRSDVVNLTAEVEPAVDGSILLNDGMHMMRAGYQVVEASSLAQGLPRPYWTGRRPKLTADFMQRVRLGLPQLGSYIVPIVVPLPVEEVNGFLGVNHADPYERSVTRKVLRAVDAARVAAESSRGGDLRPFRDAVSEGVSSNLCAAIAEAAAVPELEGITIGVAWARTTELTLPDAGAVRISRPLLSRIAEAVSFLGPKEGDHEVMISGKIEHLDYSEGDEEGTVGIRASLEGESRLVYVDLPLDAYFGAVRAHESRAIVVCRGVLAKYGRKRVISNASYFTVQPDIPTT